MSKRSLLTEWDSYLERFPRELLDIYFTERYVRLHEGTDCHAEAFLFEDDGEIFLMPFLRRSIPLLGPTLNDFETAYGYGGPLTTTKEPAFLNSASAALEKFAADSGLIAGFVRFHPIVGNASWMAHCWPVVFDRATVAVDLTLSREDMLEPMHRSYRNRLRKAEAAGLSFVTDTAFARMDDFVRLYRSTMERLEAAPEYFFTESYFEAIQRDLAGDGFIGLVLSGDTVAAAGLFLRMGAYGHAHLAASDVDYLSAGANNLLFVGGALALKSMGARVMHLGGGRSSEPDDSLLRFKRNCGSINYGFYRTQLITRHDDYANACAAWDSGPGQSAAMAPYRSFFLRFHYRADEQESLSRGSESEPTRIDSKPQVILIGGGGHARSLLDILLDDASVSIIGLLDPDTGQVGNLVEEVPVFGDDSLLGEMRGLGATNFVVGLGGVGNNEPRQRLFQAGIAAGLSPMTVIHSSAVVSTRARVGDGCQLMAGCILNTGVVLGQNVLINTGAIVDHDCVIGDHVHVASGSTLAGGVHVAELAHIGAGAVVRQNVFIGARAVVGAGAVVVKDVPAGAMVAGVPARPLREVQLDSSKGAGHDGRDAE